MSEPFLYPLKTEIQNYPWGSETAIPTLCGRTPQPGVKEAELWMGAHPRGASKIFIQGRWTSLRELIQRDPQYWLDLPEAYRTGGGEPREPNFFPFLFKVLAAAEPLSIQAHPARKQAEQGFDRENREGIPLNAGNRSYRDRNHKPEIISAVTEFEALCGFRSPEGIEENFRAAGIGEILPAGFPLPVKGGLKSFFNYLINDLPENPALLRKMQEKAAAWNSLSARLFEKYPDDPGVLAPLYLNQITLQPGEALYLPAGVLHAYVQGTGLELMANSDNVLRGGLTGKFMDKDELLRILEFHELHPEVLKPRPLPLASSSGVEPLYYTVPPLRNQVTRETFDFCLSLYRPGSGTHQYISIKPPRGPFILIALEDEVSLTAENGETRRLNPGESLYVRPRCGILTITGPGVLYGASLPFIPFGSREESDS